MAQPGGSTEIDPVLLFERATVPAAAVMARVDAERLGDPTPCAEWTVQQLIVGPPVPVPPDATAQDRLLGAMGRRPVVPESR